MSNPTLATVPPPEKAPTVELPKPQKGFQYVLVPEDLRKSAIQSSFVTAICRMSGGDFVAELSDDLEQVVSKCMSLGKKGGLTITLNIAPDSYKMLAIKPKVSTKVPKVETELSKLFATPNGQLLSRDPEQEELDLKVVEMKQQAPRVI